VSSVAFEFVYRGCVAGCFRKKHRNNVCLRTHKGFTLGEAVAGISSWIGLRINGRVLVRQLVVLRKNRAGS